MHTSCLELDKFSRYYYVVDLVMFDFLCQACACAMCNG